MRRLIWPALFLLALSMLVFSARMATADAAIAPGASAVAVLSDQSSLGSETTVNADGTSAVSDVSLDTAASTATVASDGYLCGDVQYRATIRGQNFTHSTMWTYRSTFGVHVCHNKVTAKTALYDEPMDTFFGYSWCGSIVRQWQMNSNGASAASYTKGCFTLAYKLTSTYYPWARITIGGNGNLWIRKTGF